MKTKLKEKCVAKKATQPASSPTSHEDSSEAIDTMLSAAATIAVAMHGKAALHVLNARVNQAYLTAAKEVAV
jgi:hypothetical protein